MKNVFNFIRFVLGVILIIVMIYLSVDRMGQKYCSLSEVSIELDENVFVTKDVIVDYLLENTLHPDSVLLDDVSFKGIEDLLLSHPSIKSAIVYSDMNGKVCIKVKQRKPIVRIQSEKDGFYLDEDGLRMPLSDEYTARMLLVTGDVNTISLEDVFFITDKIYKDEFLKKQIVQIDVKESEMLMLTRLGEQLEFGKVKNVKEKFEKLMLYYEKGNSQNKEYKVLNLKYQNQIVCTKK